MKRLFWLTCTLGSMCLHACGDEQARDQLGVAVAALVAAPSDARCIVITTNGSTTVTAQFDISPSTESTFRLTGLPTGNVTMSAQAYALSCASRGSSAASYVSDTMSVSISGAMPVQVTFQMHPAAGGTSLVSVNFPTPAGSELEVSVCCGSTEPSSITAGPDGNMWFTDPGTGSIGVLYMQYQYTAEYSVPGGLYGSPYIVTGPDGNLWFTGAGGDNIGRITTSGSVREFSVGVTPCGITAGPDGNVWFTYLNSDTTNGVGQIDAVGDVATFSLPTGSYPESITTGADGNLWIAENWTSKIARMSTSGSVTEFSVAGGPSRIISGPDGNAWFLEPTGKIGKITTTGSVTEYAIPTAGNEPFPFPEDVAFGADGNIWYTDAFNVIGRMTTTGSFKAFASPSDASPYGIAPGSDGNLWFCEPGKLGRISP